MNEATPLNKSLERTGAGAFTSGKNNGRFRTTVVTFVGGMVVMMMMMMMALSNNNVVDNNNNNYVDDSEGEVIRGRSKFEKKYDSNPNNAPYHLLNDGEWRGKSSKSDKSKSSKSDKKSKSPPKPPPPPTRKASIRIVENIDPTDPDGSGDIILSLGFNPLTQALSLVGSNFVTNGSVFRTKDIEVVDGVLIGTIPFEKQLGDTSSTCTITKGDFKPEQGIIFIKSATCNYSTCFPTERNLEDDDDEENCFFGLSGGTLDIDGATLIFGKTIKGVLQGGTGPFGGLAGSFTVNKIVQGVFPPPSDEIQYNIFQVDFIFDESVGDIDGCPVGICE